ncbi:MAG: ABC transporter permease [Suipraeoptans sp.]
MGKSSTFSKFVSKYVMILAFLVLVVFFATISSNFLTATNISSIVISKVATGFLALGGTFILISDEFDLSLGYNLMFSTIIGAMIAQRGGGTLIIVLSMLCTGMLVGLINGILVVHFKISSFIVTLSVGLTLLGLAQALSGGGVMYVTEPKPLLDFAKAKIGSNGIGYCVILFIIVCIILHFIYTHTVFGRQVYAIGISKKTAFLAGIQVSKIRMLAFVFSGLMAGAGGIIYMGQVGTASSSYGSSLLLPAYSVVFLSKTAFKPGYINIPGLILSLLIVAIGSNGIQLIGAPAWGAYVFEGAILCFAMWLSTRFNIREE